MKITLQELREQKALLEKQLAWLNAKIAEFEKETETVSPTQAVEKPVPVLAETEVAAPEAELAPEVESITPTEEPSIVPGDDAFALGTGTSAADTKKGCLMITVIATALVILFGVLLYMFYPSWDEEEAKRKLKIDEQEENARH